MIKLPRVVEDLIASLESLPGIGRKTAQRLAFYLLRVPQKDLDLFGKSIEDLKKKTNLCTFCHNLTEREKCSVCEDESRDRSKICVVEGFQDVLALEKSGSFDGLYHVLHGSISPLNNIGPDELFMSDLFERVKGDGVSEVVLATNTSLEGEATAMYVADRIEKEKEKGKLRELKVTRIGRGLPTGVELEYADDDTLSRAFEGRKGV